MIFFSFLSPVAVFLFLWSVAFTGPATSVFDFGGWGAKRFGLFLMGVFSFGTFGACRFCGEFGVVASCFESDGELGAARFSFFTGVLLYKQRINGISYFYLGN